MRCHGGQVRAKRQCMILVGGWATSPSSPFGFDPHADALAGFDPGWNGCSALA